MNKQSYIPLQFAQFIGYIRKFKPIESAEDDLLYNAYNELIELLKVHHDAFSTLPFQPIDHARLILYLIYDYEFHLAGLNLDERIKQMNDEIFFTNFVTTVVDKYGSESYFKYEENRLVTRFHTEISTINVYVNFISLKLNQIAINKESERLYVDLLRNAFSLCRTITELLVAGFEKEALSTWRSLHEVEAVLVLVEDRNVLQIYEEHVIYNAAFSKLLPKEKSDEIFIDIKGKMKSFNLKSKDTRRFIEYGWIRACDSFDANTHKFNFRDGVQELAGLGYARNAYKNASEAAHSSPLLLFIDPRAFLTETLRNLYQSFIVIEGLFAANYAQNTVQTEVNIYNKVREIYLKDISEVLKRLK